MPTATTATTSTTVDDQASDGPSDAELLARVREGDREAYGQLYLRHEPAATSLARYLTRTRHEADDVVADAFARVLRAIDGGAGPTEAFRPYLLTAVRRTTWRHGEDQKHTRLAASEDEAELLDLRLAVEPEDRSDDAIVLRAFRDLPERWQLVLWHTEIEGQPPAAVAPLLGLSPNATAALAVRAREGLRQAYLQAHLQAQPPDSCRFSVEHLGSFVRDGLGKRDNAKVEAHLADCPDCQDLQADLGSLNKALRSIVGPAVVGAGAARWLQERAAEAASGVGAAEHVQQVVSRIRFPQAVGLAGAAAALFVTLGVSSDLARPDDPGTPDPVAAVPIRQVVDTPTGVVTFPLAGTPAAPEDTGVQAAACDGAALPLSLPDGATPTGATLAQTGDVGDEPSVVDPDAGAGFQPVESGDAALVGDGSACVVDLIEPLEDAPEDTALVVSFLDELGELQLLVVPRIVEVVGDAIEDVVAIVEATDARLAAYLEALAGQLPGAAGGPGTGGVDGLVDGVGGTVDGVTGSLPGSPGGSSGSGPSLPALPPVGDTVDGVVGGVGDTVGGVGDTVGGVVCGLLGCP